MNLTYLLQPYIAIDYNINITGLALDTRFLEPGQVFFALQGSHFDGRQYIANAIERGASAIIQEASADVSASFGNIPCILLPNLRQLVGPIAARFYHEPAKKMQIVGITGTNGKTSCSHFTANALMQLGMQAAVIGTLGNGIYGQVQQGNLTTPDAITLQRLFVEFVKQQTKVVAMEVSSHAIDQERIAGIDFAVAVFTNLTRDHLDYHHTMEAYGAAKKRLFDNPHAKISVINQEDAFGYSLIQDLAAEKRLIAYGIQQNLRLPKTVQQVFAENVQLNDAGINADIVSPWGTGRLQVPLIGQFNLSNVLAVLTTLCALEIPFAEVLAAVSRLAPIAGRMQVLGGQNRPLVLVDYSHTPDALEKALMATRNHCRGKLYCIFGCGGDRDKGKRPLMAKIAEQYADKVIVTDDNPRHEDPAAIVADIMAGFTRPEEIIVEHDRSKAIKDIIQYAAAGDCILIAGKGAENYQIIGDEKIPFSDAEKVNAFMVK